MRRGSENGRRCLVDVLDDVTDDTLCNLLNRSKREHEALAGDIREHLDRFEDEGKDPPVMASAMSLLKTKAELMMKPGDYTVADLMTDGCGMGVKSLSKYLNQYKAADEKSKDFAKKLIAMEEELTKDMPPYL